MSILQRLSGKDANSDLMVDSRLIKRCLQQDEDAWEVLVRSYAGRIFNLSYRYTGRRQEAEDLTQDIFIRIFQNLSTFRADTGSFKSWVLSLSRNIIIDRFRRTRRFRQMGGSGDLEHIHIEDETQPNAQQNVEQDEARSIVREALATLSPENKEAIILRDLEGMRYRDMAIVLGLPEGTVKSRINRARLALAKKLSRHPNLSEVVA